MLLHLGMAAILLAAMPISFSKPKPYVNGEIEPRSGSTPEAATPAEPATSVTTQPKAEPDGDDGSEGTTNKVPRGHRVPYEPRCPVCKDPGRPELEHDYIAGAPWEELLEWVGDSYDKKAIVRHMRALDLDIERTKNTYRAMHILMEKGMERLEANLEAVTPDHMIKLIPHIDRREGRIVEHVKLDTPRQIIINAPGGLPFPSSSRVDDSEVIEGKIADDVPLLGPRDANTNEN